MTEEEYEKKVRFKKIRSEFGSGLKITVEPGDLIRVDHSGEILEFCLIGRLGNGRYQIAFRGSKEFQIQGPRFRELGKEK